MHTVPLSSIVHRTLEKSLFPALSMASLLLSEDRHDKIKDTSSFW